MLGEQWSWVRIPLVLWIFLSLSKIFYASWRASLPVLEALNFIHSLIICDPLWKNRPLALKYDFAVEGSILDSTLFFRFFFSLDILKV